VEIGARCTVMEGAVVESKAVLEPGTVVPAYSRIPGGERWGGNPASFVEVLDDEAKDHIRAHAEEVHLTAREHLLEFLPVGNTYVHLEDLEKEGVTATQG